MKTALTTIFHLVLATSQFLDEALSQRPPQLLSDIGDKQKIVPPSSVVTLPCPVYGDKKLMIFDWSKDKESLIVIGGSRHRVTANGSLRIKEVTIEDTGVYTCRAVNGFGSVEHNTTLVVLDDNEEYEDDNELTISEDVSAEKDELSTHKNSHTTKPHLLYVTPWDRSKYHRLPGSSLKLHCVATGHPKPRISWTKDENQVLPRNAKRGRWTLRLQNLQISDSGNYTCTASNPTGTTSHSFLIDVSTSPESSREKPELTGAHPSNTTVEEGQMATFQCIVRSNEPPHIEWLKRVEENEMNEDEFRDVINVDNENFRVIKSSDVMDKSDGSFLNKLVIQEASMRDTGKYICFGANTNGYSYRSAFLNVLPRPTMKDTTDSLPFPIVVAVIVVGVATLAGVVALLIYCRNRQNSESSSQSSSTSVPMVTKDVFLPMQRYPPSSKTCNTYEPPSRNKTHNQVMVYVPTCTMNSGR